jgi:hypothetical protein
MRSARLRLQVKTFSILSWMLNAVGSLAIASENIQYSFLDASSSSVMNL